MRASPWLIATLKESPHEAEVASHQLMLRAGFIRPLASGLYTWLPLGLKVLRNIERVVREELNKTGAHELLMPAIQPAELWHETGRFDTFGGQLLKIKDNNHRDYCFGPTHEEVITDLMRQELQSYKQLPVNLYQIQTKFRDEIRPRFGVMRAREFLMKDAYSFHLDENCLAQTYEKMYAAYCKIFTKLGFKFRAVEADSGAIGGAVSHEFQVLADSGEDEIAYSDTSDYAANVEQATCLIPDSLPLSDTQTLYVKGRENTVVALILRKADSLNTVRAEKHDPIASPLAFIDTPKNAVDNTLIDHHVLAMDGFNAPTPTYTAYDLRQVQSGDKSPDGKGTLSLCRGIEVGHIFQLGSKYADIMKANVLNQAGKAQTLVMGCYGLGLSRMVAAAIEQHHDNAGICLPEAMAPFQVNIIPINMHRSERVQAAAEALYERLIKQGFDVLLDDRKERPGVLFADNDLIGIPHRLVISERGLDAGTVEYKARCASEAVQISMGEVENQLKAKD